MAQQIMIIGLGQFGMSLARTLTECGAEVLAVDRRKDLVEEAATFVTEAIAIDVTDQLELAQLEPAKRDAVVCAIGDQSKEASIICTALLREMGTKYIVARAWDPMHSRILDLVGANLIINPELEFGKRFANRLLFRRVIPNTSLGDDLVLTEVAIQPSLEGRTLIDLALPRKFGVTVVGIRSTPGAQLLPVLPDQPLPHGANLVIVCKERSLTKFLSEVNS